MVKVENGKRMETILSEICKKELEQCSYEELYTALLGIVEEESKKHIMPVKGRKLYYISAEFLIGKLLSNNLINLGLYEEVKACLEAHGKSMAALEEVEPEPSLGNGGLGRLAACFLDSLATLKLPGDGIGLRYHCGETNGRRKRKRRIPYPLRERIIRQDFISWRLPAMRAVPII